MFMERKPQKFFPLQRSGTWPMSLIYRRTIALRWSANPLLAVWSINIRFLRSQSSMSTLVESKWFTHT
jgi:hypothetical protein